MLNCLLLFFLTTLSVVSYSLNISISFVLEISPVVKKYEKLLDSYKTKFSWTFLQKCSAVEQFVVSWSLGFRVNSPQHRLPGKRRLTPILACSPVTGGLDALTSTKRRERDCRHILWQGLDWSAVISTGVQADHKHGNAPVSASAGTPEFQVLLCIIVLDRVNAHAKLAQPSKKAVLTPSLFSCLVLLVLCWHEFLCGCPVCRM